MKKIEYIFFCFFLCFCFLTLEIPSVFAYNDNKPSIVGEAGIVMDVKTGTVLYEKNAHKILEPASTTKIMTGILALEKGDITDIVVADEEAFSTGGSSIYLKEGESLTLEQMLYGMLLNSGNDAAIAIAKHIAGSIPTFTDMMNKKASKIGAKNTNFANPNGLPNKEHFTTAYDLALISRYAMLHLPEFRKIVSTKTYMIPWQGEKWDRKLINHNKLLWNYEGANGIKTGYTSSAGQTIVVSANRDNQELIAVVLKSEGRNIGSDAKKLLDYGFDNFKSVDIIEKNKHIATVDVKYGSELKIMTSDGFAAIVPKNGSAHVTKNIKLKPNIVAPIKKGEVIGKIEFRQKDKKVGDVNLVSDRDIKRKLYTNWWFFPLMFLAAFYVYFRVCIKIKRYRQNKTKLVNR